MRKNLHSRQSLPAPSQLFMRTLQRACPASECAEAALPRAAQVLAAPLLRPCPPDLVKQVRNLIPVATLLLKAGAPNTWDTQVPTCICSRGLRRALSLAWPKLQLARQVPLPSSIAGQTASGLHACRAATQLCRFTNPWTSSDGHAAAGSTGGTRQTQVRGTVREYKAVLQPCQRCAIKHSMQGKLHPPHLLAPPA